MGEGKRPTAELDRGELQRLATLSVRAPTNPGPEDLERDPPLALGSDRPDRPVRAANRDPHPTSKIDDGELVGLLNLADGTPALPREEVVPLVHDDRKTAKMRAKQFQALLRGDARATLPITNEVLKAIDWNADTPAVEAVPIPAANAGEPAAKPATRPPAIIKRSEPLSAKPATKPPAAIVEPIDPEAVVRSVTAGEPSKPAAMIVEPAKRPMVSMRALTKPGEDIDDISDGAPIELTVVKSRPVAVPRPAPAVDPMRRVWIACTVIAVLLILAMLIKAAS